MVTTASGLVSSKRYPSCKVKNQMASIDIVDMPVEENLKLMESLWDSLCATHAEGMSTPRRHGDVLAERACRLASGEESVSAWIDAKERIRSQIKAN